MTLPSPATRPSTARVWLQLFRAPNLFTVPGDPLAGYLFANGWDVDRTLLFTILASLCFYAAGLLMNDLADEAEDLRDRPSRPLPSQAVQRRSVWSVLVLLCLAGLGLLALCGSPAALVAGLALIASVSLYNWVTKGWPVIGALNMGLCRSLSVMLGAYAGPRASWDTSVVAALGFGLYIAAITNLARHETRAKAPVVARLLPLLAVCLNAYAGIWYAKDAPDKLPAAALFVLTVAVVFWLAVKMFRASPPPLPPMIGAHIRALLLLQAASCYLAESTEYGRYAAAVLVCLWPLSRWVGRWFYAS